MGRNLVLICVIVNRQFRFGENGRRMAKSACDCSVNSRPSPLFEDDADPLLLAPHHPGRASDAHPPARTA